MKARILFWLKVGVSIALLGYLLSLIDLDRLLEKLQEVDVRYLAVAFVLLLLQTGFSSLKWQVILRADGVLMRLPFLIKTYLIGGFISLFLPTSFGGDIYRVAAAERLPIRTWRKAHRRCCSTGFSGLFALISICMIAYVVLPEQPYGVAVLILYVLGVVGFFVVSSITVGQLDRGIRDRVGEESRQDPCLVSQLPQERRHPDGDPSALVPVPAQPRRDQQGLHGGSWPGDRLFHPDGHASP